MLRSAPSWWARQRGLVLARRAQPAARPATASTAEDEPRERGRHLRWVLPLGAAVVLLGSGVTLALATPPLDLGGSAVRTLTDVHLVVKPKAPREAPASSVVSAAQPAAPAAGEPAAQVGAASTGGVREIQPQPPAAEAPVASPSPKPSATAAATPSPTATQSPTATASPSPTATAPRRPPPVREDRRTIPFFVPPTPEGSETEPGAVTGAVLAPTPAGDD